MKKKICKVEYCESKVLARGLCIKHYTRYRKYGDTSIGRTKVIHSICKVDGCNIITHAKGYCSKHYAKFKKYGDPLFGKSNEDHNDTCLIDGCNNSYYSLGYCLKHYQRLKTHGDPLFTKIGQDMERHGMNGTSEYIAWGSMKTRCFNKNNKSYYRYGGRGITICDRWKNSFVNFYADMGDKPFKGAEIDRIDNDKGYYKSNCRWVTSVKNIRNNSTTRLTINKVIEIRNSLMNINELAMIHNVSKGCIYGVINNLTWKGVGKGDV